MATGITRDDVWQAADALLMEGARPTIERIRQKMGRGSPNTVGPHLDGWFRGLGQRLEPAGGEAGKGALPAAVAALAAQFWQAARQAARAEHAQEAAALQEEHRQARARLDEETTRLEQRAEQMVRREQDQQEAFVLLKSQLQAANARGKALEDALQQAQERLAELTAQQGRANQQLATLANQLEAERARHAQERAAADERSRTQEKRWLMELDSARELAKRQAQQHEQASKAAEARIQEESRAVRALGEELRQGRDALARAQADMQASRAAAEAGALTIGTLQEQVRQLLHAQEQHQLELARREEGWREQTGLQQDQTRALQAQIAQLLQQLDDRNAELLELRKPLPASSSTVRKGRGGRQSGPQP